eukprot:366425-Chlamydomonas_euryale.AAC.5
MHTFQPQDGDRRTHAFQPPDGDGRLMWLGGAPHVYPDNAPVDKSPTSFSAMMRLGGVPFAYLDNPPGL